MLAIYLVYTAFIDKVPDQNFWTRARLEGTLNQSFAILETKIPKPKKHANKWRALNQNRSI
ncbi:hypothetical protein VIN01S_21910 [Vibrio inusitatus NBRC 102082]|uniref:Uncharacterized protein n=1 Tax=Vibrio inusitatus NBRC 102082 TaxID=1219070 RepID=A0A4Y3HWE5_9VIBR|nr:hypothetical protein VIN01S_21910 [Vibrio inusitatus NBRC 102082]